VQVNAVSVHLPDLHREPLERLALQVEDASRQVGDLADGRGGARLDEDEVVVHVER
jgi:hypothetical protein